MQETFLHKKVQDECVTNRGRFIKDPRNDNLPKRTNSKTGYHTLVYEVRLWLLMKWSMGA